MTTGENVMTYQITQIKRNSEDMFSSDLYIENIVTKEEVVATGVRVWDEDQYSLAYMFKLVKNNKWLEGVLSDEEIAEIEAEGIFDDE